MVVLVVLIGAVMMRVYGGFSSPDWCCNDESL
jgi:hypothetical protein